MSERETLYAVSMELQLYARDWDDLQARIARMQAMLWPASGGKIASARVTNQREVGEDD